MKKAIGWVIGLVVLVLIIIAVSGGKSGTSGPIKIGFVNPLTGDAAALGQQAQHVIDYRLKQINEAAGDKGQKFEIVYEDGKCAANEAVGAFQKLTDIDGVKVIIGGLCSSETLAMSPLANEKHIVLVSNGSSNPKIENEGPYTFSLSYSDKMTGEQLAKAVSGAKKVAIITEQNDYNIGVRDVFVDSLKQYPGVELVSNESFPKGSPDLRGVLTKVRATAPDALVLNPNVGVTAENLLKQLAEMKTWKGYKIYSQIAYLSDAVRKPVGAFAEGMVLIDVPTVTDLKFKEISDAIIAKSGTLNDLGSYYTAATLDDLDLVTSLISKNGNDPEKIQQDLSSGTFAGFIGEIKFAGNNYVNFSTPGIYVVQDGKAVLQ